MPTFKQVKSWIRQAAESYGAYVSEKHAQSLAGAYMTSMESDPQLTYNSLTYSDETGEQAVRRWFASRLAVAA